MWPLRTATGHLDVGPRRPPSSAPPRPVNHGSPSCCSSPSSASPCLQRPGPASTTSNQCRPVLPATTTPAPSRRLHRRSPPPMPRRISPEPLLDYNIDPETDDDPVIDYFSVEDPFCVQSNEASKPP
ncbi:vegetative cell wall protein gp1-like [Hordeum vulgare subsp. vulgare]|uniref:vegetative cell wall protein gp1-like n=1 Tax=Hordeum vulgare subsp. vulgare TaxID=112509 RepID=UPI001D1A56EA|nr:vegetative cell wall protein gp1-like [Hordeum vulgare subsp. vulgare]